MIRTVTILSILLLATSALFAQNEAVERVLTLKAQKISKIEPKSAPNTILIPSSFSQESLRHASTKKSGDLQTVYYIYTSYKQSPSFNQKALNEERIKRLSELIPEVLENRYVEWKIIEQTACASPAEGKTYYHGFVLEYRPRVTAIDREKEIENLRTFLENPEAGYQLSNDPTVSSLSQQIAMSAEKRASESASQSDISTPNSNSEANFPEGNYALYQYLKEHIPGGGEIALNRDDSWVEFDMDLDENGKIGEVRFKNEVKEYIKEVVVTVLEEMPNWNPAIENGDPVASSVNLSLRMSYSPIVKGMFNRDGKKPNFSQEEVAASVVKSAAPDEQTEERINAAEISAVYRGMEAVIPREKVAVVMDVTSSMSLHLASMNWWVAQASTVDSLNIVHYTFFNDGDNVEDRKKKSGQTGGIYHGSELKELSATLMEAMRRGNGGDIVENDFEAILAAQNQANQANAILLIVDNFSDVRDEKLLSQISLKTHVLVAGDVTIVRECYLNLAKATGGDLLVNGNRISLKNVSDGGRVTVANATYTYDGQKFTLL